MKLLYKSFLSLIFIMFFAYNAKAQCLANDIADNCITKLNSSFNFVKSFPLDGKEGKKSKIENAYIFAKGTQYMIKVCSKDDKTADGIIISLYDQKKNLVSTSKIQNKVFSTIVYPCNSTGIYYIEFKFDKKSKNYCGGAVLGFKR